MDSVMVYSNEKIYMKLQCQGYVENQLCTYFWKRIH